MFPKEKVQMMTAEFLGTALLSLVVLKLSHMFGLGTAAWYTSLTAGLTLALIVALFGRFSGAHVNPAVTVGLWTLKKIDAATAIVYLSTQMLAGAVSLILYNYLAGDKLAMSGSAQFSGRIFVAEVLGSAIFGMGIAMAVVRKLEGAYASFVIGASLAFGALTASIAAPGFLNPAVALANNAWDKTVAVAPIIGVVIGMNLYNLLFSTEAKTTTKKR